MKKGNLFATALLFLGLGFISQAVARGATVAQNAATFTGSGYLRTQRTTQQFFPSAAFTYELWFKADQAGALINEVHQFTESAWDHNFLEVDSQGRLIATAPGVSAIIGPAIAFGTWHHAAIRYNPSAGDLDLFLNGAKVGTSKGSRLLPWSNGHSVFLTFGRSSPGKPWLRGQIDEVRLWRAALTDEDIAARYRIKLATGAGTLFAMWSLDSTQGTSEGYPTSPDRSGNSNPALLVGGVGFSASGADLMADERPSATTGPATVGSDRVTLTGTGNSSVPALAYFRYGRDGAIDQATTPVTIQAGTNTPVEAVLQNLASQANYSYALVVSNQFGINQGATRTFVSPSQAAQRAATFAGNGYLRSQHNTQQFFRDAAFTFELWFKADAAGALINEVHQFTEPLWDFNFLEIDTARRLVASLPGVTPVIGPTIEFGTWHHTAIRYNPTNRNLDLFLDGAKVGTSTGTRLLPWDAGHTAFMTFARSAPGKPWLRGQIDEVRMWGTALTDDEIANNRRLKLAHADGRLFAMWSLDVVQGSSEGYPTSPDRSANNNPALLVGNVTFTPSGADVVNDARPAAVTGPATVGATSVTLTGMAASGTPALAYFRYGRDGSLDQTTSTIPIAAGTNAAVEAVIEGLVSQGNYSYALVVSNDFGISQGVTRTFTAPDLRPIATTGPVRDSAGTSTVLTGAATTQVAGTAHFIWGETNLNNRTPDITVSAGTSPVEFTLENLEVGRTYRYALVVSNSAGSRTGATRTFTKIGANAVAQQAATFDGNGYLRSQHNTQQFFRDAAFTYELWFKADAAGALINEVHQFTEPLWDYNFLEIDSQRRLVAAVPGVSAITGPTVDFGKWYHAAIRYNPATRDLDLFLDGAKVGTSRGTRLLPWDAGHTTFMTFARSAPGRPWLRGQIDEVRMWRTVQSDEEISANRRVKFENGDPRLFAMWSLDVIQGSSEGYPTSPDRSGNNNPALLVGRVTLSASGADLVRDQRPSATTGEATVGSTTVTLNGTAISSVPAVAYFRFGRNGSLTDATASVTVAAGTNVPVQAVLEGLVAEATYSYAVVVSNEFGISQGAVRTFVAPNFVAQNAATFAGNGYLRSQHNTEQFFRDAAFTYELWFKANAAGALINEVHQFTESLWDYNFLEVNSQRQLVAAAPGVPTITGPAIEFGTWHHAAIRYNATTRNLDLFLDGAKVGTSNGTRRLPWESQHTAFMTFGRSAPGRPWLRGQIDEVRMWKTALTDEEIAANRRLKLLNPDARLFAMWSLDVIQGSSEGYPTSPDRSANNNPALLVRTVTLTPSGADLVNDQRPVGPVAVTGPFEDSPGSSGALTGTATSPTPAIAYFVWGEGNLNNRTRGIGIPGGPAPVAIDTVLNGLEGGKTYQYALVVNNQGGTHTGEVRTFTKATQGGSAVLLSGNAYIRTVNDQRSYFPEDTITAELWVRPSKAGVVMAEVDRVNSAFLDSSIIEILTSGDVVAGFPGIPTIFIGAVQMNEWNHIAIRYNKATQRMDGWVNGVKSANSSTGDRITGWELGRQLIYTFGKSAADRIGTGEQLNGEFDEIRLWSGARSDAQITATYNKKLSGSETGLVAYYRMDERSTTLQDYSGRNNPGQIVNASGATFVTSSAPITVNAQPIAMAEADSLQLQFTGVPGRQLRLRSSANFVNWTDGPVVIVDAHGVATFTVPKLAEEPLLFYSAQSF